MKIGLEIHQRLNTLKLFCNCPSEGKGEVKGSVMKKVPFIRTEMGDTDEITKIEEELDKTFEYVIYDNSCGVELNEEKPHEMDREALLVALAMSTKLNMEINPEIRVHRKIVVDGSNTTGYQRTAVVGKDGNLETSKGDVGIETLCIEEESSSILGDKGELKYGLDRLGIPLIEIATAPDIKDGVHARETAEKIGMLLRMTGKVLRGIGTIRQDVNVSIEGGTRVEIKGAQELDDIPLLVEKECKRQENLIKIINKLPSKPSGEIQIEEVTELLVNGKGWIQREISKGKVAMGMKLPGLDGILGIELYENRRYGTEISDYAKVYGFGGIIHGDEDLEKYSINKSEIKQKLNLSEGDNFVILIGDKGERMNLAFKSMFERAYLKHVPGETRKAIINGGSQFMRVKGGMNKLYLDEDVSPIKITKEMLEESGKYYPRNPEDVLKELEEETNKDLGIQLLKSKYLMDYRSAVSEGVNPVIAAVTFVNTIKNVSRDKINVDNITGDEIIEILIKYKNEGITKKGIEEIIRRKCNTPKLSINEIIEKYNYKKMGREEIIKIISEEGKDVRKIMGKYAHNIEASELIEIIKTV